VKKYGENGTCGIKSEEKGGRLAGGKVGEKEKRFSDAFWFK
jgi:hypothetical protein